MSNLLKSDPFWVTVVVLALLVGSTIKVRAETGGGLVCRSPKGIEAVFDIGNANPRLSMPDAVRMVNSVAPHQCTFERETFNYEPGKVVGTATHETSLESFKVDIVEATIGESTMFVIQKHKEVSKADTPFQ